MEAIFTAIFDFFIKNTPPLRTILAGGPIGLLWALACLTGAGLCKRRLGMRTGYTRKIFHFLIFSSVAAIQWLWGTPIVCLFGGMTTLVVFYAVWRGSGHLLYEAMAREADAPHRTYFIVAPYFATLIGGLATNMLFGQAALLGYLVTGLGDAVGEPAGVRFGRHPYRVPSVRGVAAVRTWEGSAAVLAACLVAVVLGVAFSPVLDWRRGALTAVPALALACAAIEAVSPHGWDNMFMQLLPTTLAVLLFGAPEGAA